MIARSKTTGKRCGLPDYCKPIRFHLGSTPFAQIFPLLSP
jgi:hypothetical protein